MHDSSAPSVDSIVGKLANRNLNWDRIRDRIAAAGLEQQQSAETILGPYVTFARLHGAGGGQLARRVGAALGWPVLDHALLDMVAERLDVDPTVLSTLDKGADSWVSDMLAEVMPTVMVSRDEYTRCLRRVLQFFAVHGQVVFLGRAANLFLPPARGVSVFVVATLEDRIARVRERRGVGAAQARDEIEEIDRGRKHFVLRTFDRSWTDATQYDLVVNTSLATIDELTEVLVSFCRRRPGLQSPAAAPEHHRRVAAG